MKWLQICLIILSILMTYGPCTAQNSFHTGGGGDCGGCHNMHTSSTSGPTGTGNSQSTENIYLLNGADQSSTCLNCHQSTGSKKPSDFYICTADADMPAGLPPVQLTPGGDFGWLKKSYSWVGESDSLNENSPSERHGHNIIARDFGYVQDSTNIVAPGGTYPSSNLHCSSCHDPHGRYRRHSDGTITTSDQPIKGSGSYSSSQDPDENFAVGVYRLLGGVGYMPKSLGANAFVNSPPAAVAPDIYNRAETTTQTRVAYGRDMSEWCMNCHTSFIGSDHLHPAGNNAKLGTTVSENYNSYIKTGDFRGVIMSSYLSLIPFEEGVDDHSITAYNQLKTHAKNDDSFLQGPHNNANISCISCHRAHATGWDSAGRYNLKSSFVTVADSGGIAAYPDPAIRPDLAMGRTSDETRKAYYDRPAAVFGVYQRSLCNKCHSKD